MTFPRSIKIAAALVAVACLAFLGRQGQRYHKKHFAGPRSGEVVYREDCMRCHGPVGEGVAGKADEPLVGEKSVASLAKYIAREMPEDDPGALSMADATASAEYIHQAFYSAEARARNHPPRIELAHLTVRQYRESIADLLGSLRGGVSTTESGGLSGVYRERPERDPKMPDRKPWLGSGGLFNNTPNTPGRDPLVRADKPFGEWNQFRIRQVGSKTWVWLNDQLVVDGAVMENYFDRTKPLPEKGPIMLQTHGGEIRWRNLFVRPLRKDGSPLP